MNKKIKYNLSYDLENMRKFKSNWENDSVVFKCVICGRKCSIATSFSNEGHKLICENCYREKFDSKFGSFDYWRKH